MSAITRATCSLFLKNLNREVWEERRNIVKAKAEMTQENEEAVASRTRVSRTKANREQINAGMPTPGSLIPAGS